MKDLESFITFRARQGNIVKIIPGYIDAQGSRFSLCRTKLGYYRHGPGSEGSLLDFQVLLSWNKELDQEHMGSSRNRNHLLKEKGNGPQEESAWQHNGIAMA